MGSLTNLERLWLAGNQLTGEIPAELGDLTKLKYLDLSNNQLTGEIPAELGGLANLQWLYLYGNQLSGEIPGGTGQPHQPARAAPPRQPVERGDTVRTGQPRQPAMAAPRRQPVERGDTCRTGQPHRPGGTVPEREPVDRVHSGGYCGRGEQRLQSAWSAVLRGCIRSSNHRHAHPRGRLPHHNLGRTNRFP